MKARATGPGRDGRCWCDQPAAVRYDPTERTGAGWVDRAGRFVPVYRCALHVGGENGLRSFLATVLP